MTFDSHIENAFVIRDHQDRVARYPVDERGLYVREMLPPVDCYVSYVHATSIEGYTPREVERAARARKLYHDLSAENIRNVKVWLRSNQAKNVPISVDDVNLAEKIYLADVATLKGKSVRPHPPVVTRNDMIELPPELMIEGRKIELAIDIVYINGEAFLHSVYRRIKYNGIVSLGTT